MAGLVTSFGSGAATNTLEEIRHTDCIFIIGSNTSAQHPLAYARISDAVKNNGAKLIVVDPRRTPVAQMAHLHLPIAPGTNLALINAMMHVILHENLQNSEFITTRTENFAALAASVQNTTPAWAAAITGLAAEDIIQAARFFATAPTAMTLYCMGVTQHVTGTYTCRALANMTMLCGMVGRPSAGLLPLRGQNNVQGSCDMGALPETLPGYVQAGSTQGHDIFAPVWGDFSNKEGKKLTEMMHAMQQGHIKALYVMGENPMLSDADKTSTENALRALDLLIVQDLFITETAQLAHVILPAASSLEKDGTFTNTERRVQRIRRALGPVGEARPDWHILGDLMARIDGKVSQYSNAEDIFEEIRTVVPSYAGINYARLEAEQGLCWPCLTEEHAGTPILHTKQFSRGLGLFTVNAFEAVGQQKDEDYPFILVTGRLAHHYHTGTMTRLSWALERESPTAFLEMHPDDAAKIGARNMWNVRIKSLRGEISATLHVTKNISPGIVFLPFHFWESAANVLTSHEHLDPIVKIPEFKVSAVSVSVIP